MSVKTTKEDLIRPLIRSNIKAKDIVRALTQKVNGLVRLILRRKKILGKLDLKDRLVPIPLTFRNCEFLGTVDLRNCEFKQSVDFTGCTFHKGLNSGDKGGSRTVYKRDLVANEAVFKNSVGFVGSHFEGRASFRKAVFEGKENALNFAAASVEDSLYCSGATFKGSVDFSSLKCGNHGVFDLANFEGEWGDEKLSADFRMASFGGSLQCEGATFEEAGKFGHVRCEGAAIFCPAKLEEGEGSGDRRVSFGKTADFRFASFGSALDCKEALFMNGANFAAVKCEDYMDLSFATFKSRRQPIIFTRAYIGGALYCHDTSFRGPVIFYNASLGILSLGDNCEFAPEKLDLRELTFKRFDGSLEQARRFVERQNSAMFSRDPYIQLEQYFTSVGKDAQARDIYYEGHLALRDNAQKRNGSVEWSRGTNILDWLWKTLTRYGVSIWRLLAIGVGLVVVGTLVFHLPDLYLSQETLKLASASASAANWEQGWLYRAAYSLDLFLPLVNLHVDEKWTPNGPILQAYAILHAMVGWLIVPLLIAALAGIIRR